MCTGAIRRTHTTNLLSELQWPTLKSRRTMSKMSWFYKIWTKQVPEYLFSLLFNVSYINQSNSRLATSQYINLVGPKYNTTKYCKSFFPDCIRQWNVIRVTSLDAVSTLCFRAKLTNSLMTPLHEAPYAGLFVNKHIFGVSKILTQIRLGLSPLRFSLFSHCIRDNPFCPSCGSELETPSHYFLKCQSYVNSRNVLLTELGIIKAAYLSNFTATPPPDLIILDCLIKGFPPYPNRAQFPSMLSLNRDLYNAVKLFITSSGRFRGELE